MSLREIFVVEDDASVRQALSAVLAAAGYEVVCFLDGDAVLAEARKRYPLCILLDIWLPEKSGLEILKELKAENYPAPIFVISGHGTIDIAIQAIKDGAIDFIQKPFKGSELVNRIEAALEKDEASRSLTLGGGISLNLPGQAALTGREREILTQTLLGKSTKEMSRIYGISPRTIEGHRSSIKKKTGGKTAIELVRCAIGSDNFEKLVTATTKTISKQNAN
jgi:FixJ family two-component response regulator